MSMKQTLEALDGVAGLLNLFCFVLLLQFLRISSTLLDFGRRRRICRGDSRLCWYSLPSRGKLQQRVKSDAHQTAIFLHIHVDAYFDRRQRQLLHPGWSRRQNARLVPKPKRRSFVFLLIRRPAPAFDDRKWRRRWRLRFKRRPSYQRRFRRRFFFANCQCGGVAKLRRVY